MKHLIYTLLSLSLLLGFSACQKEEITSEPITEKDDPKEVDYPVFQGYVIDENGNNVPNTTVSIYQHGEEVGETQSDANGFYTTVNTVLDTTGNVHLYTRKENLISKLKIVPPETKEVKLKILNQANNDYETEPLENPGDTTLAKVTGQVLTTTSKPAFAYVDIIYDPIRTNANTINVSGVRDITDDDGNFEIYVPRNTTLYFSLVEKYCEKNILNEIEENDFFSDYDVIEPLQTDTILNTFTNGADVDLNSFSVSCYIKDCDSQSIPNFPIVIFAENNNANVTEHIFLFTDENGYLEYEFISCGDGFVYTFKDFWLGSFYDTDFTVGNNVNLGDIPRCFEGEEFEGVFNIEATTTDGTLINESDDFYASVIYSNESGAKEYSITLAEAGFFKLTFHKNGGRSLSEFSFTRNSICSDCEAADIFDLVGISTLEEIDGVNYYSFSFELHNSTEEAHNVKLTVPLYF